MKQLIIIPELICYFFAIIAYSIHEIFGWLEWRSEQLMELLGKWTSDLYNLRKKRQ